MKSSRAGRSGAHDQRLCADGIVPEFAEMRVKGERGRDPCPPHDLEAGAIDEAQAAVPAEGPHCNYWYLGIRAFLRRWAMSLSISGERILVR